MLLPWGLTVQKLCGLVRVGVENPHDQYTAHNVPNKIRVQKQPVLHQRPTSIPAISHSS